MFNSGTLGEGASINDAQRYGDSQSKFGALSLTNQVTQVIFGVDRTVNNSLIVNDGNVEYNLSTITSMFISGCYISTLIHDYTENNNVNGIISPFEIRNNFFQNQKINSSFDTKNKVRQYIDKNEIIEPFIEFGTQTINSSNEFVSSLVYSNGSLVFMPEQQTNVISKLNIVTPFDDSYGVTKSLTKKQLNVTSTNFVNALLQLSGSTEFNKQRVFSSCGSTYHDSTLGTDSIAFGGLMGYKQI